MRQRASNGDGGWWSEDADDDGDDAAREKRNPSVLGTGAASRESFLVQAGKKPAMTSTESQKNKKGKLATLRKSSALRKLALREGDEVPLLRSRMGTSGALRRLSLLVFFIFFIVSFSFSFSLSSSSF